MGNREIQAAFKARMQERGFIQANEWIPASQREALKQFAKSLREEGPVVSEVTSNQPSDPLSATEKTKLERAIKAHKKVLDIQFEQRVKQYLDEILPMYAAEYDRYKAFNDTYTGVFTDDEFRLLLSVLHPDRCQPERTNQFSKAFHLIKSKEEILCKIKANDRPTSMPSTLDELIARRKGR